MRYLLQIAMCVVLLFAPTFASAQTPPTPAQCTEAWTTTEQARTLAAYQEFLRFFGSCQQAPLARQAVQDWSDGDTTRGARVSGSASAGVSPSAMSFPSFPWPAPQASARTTLARAQLAAQLGSDPSLYDLGAHMSRALGRAGYSDHSFYAAPNGFALVTRLESLGASGNAIAGGFRYAPRGDEIFSVSANLAGLFGAPAGRFRQVVFLVTNRPLSEAAPLATYGQAQALARAGANRLPDVFRTMPYSNDYQVNVLVYEFERTAPTAPPRLVERSRINARTHLVRTGMYNALLS